MANERLAQTYAQAMFEEAMASWLTPLKVVAEAIAQRSLVEQLDHAGVDLARKQAMLQPLFPPNTSPLVHNLVSLLASKNQMHLLPGVISAFEHYTQAGQISAHAQIKSAVALTPAEKSAFETKLRAQYGNDLAFEYVVDAEILGGVVVRVGDQVIDGSIAGKLAELKEKLK